MFLQKIENYFNSLKDKRVAVLGIGVSHLPLINLLVDKGISVIAYDRRTEAELGDVAMQLQAKNVTLCLGEDYLENLSGDVIFKTPGMRFDLPQLAKAVAAGSVLTSEMEVFFDLCPCKIIAITGSDGKTTTTTLVSEMLKAAGFTVHLGGNIGKPLLPEVEHIAESDIAVVELSSFQLHTMRQSAARAVVTNLAPNHLDMHKDMAEYVDAKQNIYRYQGENDLLVLNYDNDITRPFKSEAKGKTRYFSFREVLREGIYYQNGVIFDALQGEPRALLNRKDIRLPGDHNVENYMAAIAVVRDLVEDEHILQVARNFGGVKHRIEFVREVSGVRFYNDSIASSPTRTLASIRAFDQKVHLLAGGYDKKIPFDDMGEVLPRYVKALYLSGHTAGKIRVAVETGSQYDAAALPIVETEDYKQAVELAYQNAKAGDVVILSPACASFDKFKNFEKRGEYFINCVKELKEKCNE
ncbi:MAG: UDP-N-acetylmuramoyl-L-alanine--D-glutamate ligase [Clostridia bacterium]|nr:UDP-N-acetylmuramoyl-L-alanine--D-glutamate ligase [Clostridia bacterium]